jgi:hypothetical protein
MAEISIFEDEAFSVPNLAVAINEQPFVPGRIARLGLFREESVPTLTVQVEFDGDRLRLVFAKPRGGVPQVETLGRRKLLPFNVVHLPEWSTMMADEIQGIRAFGKQSELEVAQARVAKYQAKHRTQLDMTHEWQRIGAIKGLVLDADGTTPLIDIYDAFKIDQQSVAFDLGTAGTLVRKKATQVVDLISDALGGTPFMKVRALCGKNFWEDLIEHKSVRETYLNTSQAAELRGALPDEFELGGIIFERYRGKVGPTAYVADDEAHAFPEGVPDMFVTWFGPADWMETVNTDGLPYYSKVERMPFDKGVQIESQSNPLHMNTRPGATIRLVRGAAV